VLPGLDERLDLGPLEGDGRALGIVLVVGGGHRRRLDDARPVAFERRCGPRWSPGPRSTVTWADGSNSAIVSNAPAVMPSQRSGIAGCSSRARDVGRADASVARPSASFRVVSRGGTWRWNPQVVSPSLQRAPSWRSKALISIPSTSHDQAVIVDRLRAAGCIFAEDEAGCSSTRHERRPSRRHGGPAGRRYAARACSRLGRVLGLRMPSGRSLRPRPRTEFLVAEAVALARAPDRPRRTRRMHEPSSSVLRFGRTGLALAAALSQVECRQATSTHRQCATPAAA
jgi:hypothetical protein